LKDWIQAFRLRTLPLALACIGMGGIIAYVENGFQSTIFLLTLLTAFLLQILSNIANDYGDSMNGADSVDRVGPSRAVQTGKISAEAMKRAMILFAVLSFASGLGLLYLSIASQQEFFIFLGLGIVCVIAAITYTVGDNPYGYAGLGDISVLLFFGLVSVAGTYYLQMHSLGWNIMLPSIACGSFAVGVLNVNNIRDIESDKKAGKYSIPVRLGRENAVYYHWFLLAVGWLAAILYVANTYTSYWQWLFVITLPLFLINAKAVRTKKDPKELDPYLKQMAISTLVFVIVFGIGQYIGMI
jgi:1,4-dihydroxy-2-naphthoate octaprenyltransferase